MSWNGLKNRLRPRVWRAGPTIVDVLTVVLIALAAKTALAEPYYVPSGSMEPTLQIGDELLATKYPYGYSSASLPFFVRLPDTKRVLGALPRRGDVVVFRWPGDHAQIWVKRVVGLPGDRVAMQQRPALAQRRTGRPCAGWFRPGRIRDGARDSRWRASSRRSPAIASIRSSSRTPPGQGRSTTCPNWWCRRIICSSWVTIATTRPTAAFQSRPAVSACCRFPIWLVGWTRGRVVGLGGQEQADLGMAIRPAAVSLLYRRALSVNPSRWLAHDARNAARPVMRRLDRFLQVAMRGRHAITWAPIGPGAAALLALAGVRAGFALRVGRGLNDGNRRHNGRSNIRGRPPSAR